MAQQSPLLAKEEHQGPQKSQTQLPPPPPEQIQYYPIFYLQPNFPFPGGMAQQTTTGSRPWFVCHPVTANDPFFPFISELAQPSSEKAPEKLPVAVKIEDDQENKVIENQQSIKKDNSKKQKESNKKKKVPPNPGEIDKQPCNCSQSNCLKRYCGCFHSGRMCLEECACNSCKNCQEFLEERDQAINHVFRKCHRDKNIPIQELLSLQVSYGCKCKSTGCQKNYCECFKREQPCGKLCQCEGCCNIQLVREEQAEKKKRVRIQK